VAIGAEPLNHGRQVATRLGPCSFLPAQYLYEARNRPQDAVYFELGLLVQSQSFESTFPEAWGEFRGDYLVEGETWIAASITKKGDVFWDKEKLTHLFIKLCERSLIERQSRTNTLPLRFQRIPLRMKSCDPLDAIRLVRSRVKLGRVTFGVLRARVCSER